VGANGGSVNGKELQSQLEKFPTFEEAMADLLCRNALEQCRALEKYGVRNIKVALKSSSIPVTLASYRKFAAETDYPLHLGLTESGPPSRGIIKSCAVLSVLLSEGIGDTIRISLTAPPEEEVTAAKKLLEALGARSAAPELVSCPSCGRTEFDLFGLTAKVEQLLERIEKAGLETSLKKIAVMGCPVNGPGEARDADLGIAGSREGKVILFRSGVVQGTFGADEGYALFEQQLLETTRKRKK
jgi:(E)-4-hydroxy-3-methylbut-2-enyl-diphosphate synthase